MPVPSFQYRCSSETLVCTDGSTIYCSTENCNLIIHCHEKSWNLYYYIHYSFINMKILGSFGNYKITSHTILILNSTTGWPTWKKTDRIIYRCTDIIFINMPVLCVCVWERERDNYQPDIVSYFEYLLDHWVALSAKYGIIGLTAPLHTA